MNITIIEAESGVSNAKRVKWGEEALDFYRLKNRCGDDIETAAVDLIADLLHFVKASGLSVNDIMRVARGHFDYEYSRGIPIPEGEED